MLKEMSNEIDAVVVSTPDHTHAPASMMAMELNKPVYCQKPLTHFVSEARAMKWITSNPARAAGIYDQTGSLKVGKNADVVVWSKNPFSVYALAEKVLIDGAIAYDREKNLLPASDFDIGIMSPNKNRIEE